MKNDKTIDSVARDGLCTGCGSCVAICPLDAIEMLIDHCKAIYLPRLDKEKCNQCGLCFEVCPGRAVDFKQLNAEIFGKQPEDILLGNYLNCYIGHATDYDIRYNSTSGGLVTALLIFTLEQGIIDGALVTRMSENNPLEPQPFIARTREEIISASKSKYCPVPANIALKDILEAKESERFAVVGLPCHIHGVRKAEVINKKLKERIVLHLGLFCGSPATFLWTEFLLQRKGIRREEVTNLDHRGEGWPGGMLIRLKNSTSRFIPFGDAGVLRMFYCPSRCNLCCDHTAELADISFGDAWLPEFNCDRVGKSIVICRSRQVEEFSQCAVSQGQLELDRVDSEKAIQSQGGLYYKKRVIVSSFAFSRLRRKSIPFYNAHLLKPNAATYLRSLSSYLGIWVASRHYLWGLLSAYASLRGFITRTRIRIQKLFC